MQGSLATATTKTRLTNGGNPPGSEHDAEALARIADLQTALEQQVSVTLCFYINVCPSSLWKKLNLFSAFVNRIYLYINNVKLFE